MTAQNEQIHGLLDQVMSDYARKRFAVERRLAESGTIVDLPLLVDPPVPVEEIPTFEPGTKRFLSSMLKARFEYASAITRLGEVWLGLPQTGETIQSDSVQTTFSSHRRHWQDSAPMRFPPKDISLFAITPGVPQNLTYLVWNDGRDEPELWRYQGMNSRSFKDLRDYLRWVLT
jgi:hypothetical protein